MRIESARRRRKTRNGLRLLAMSDTVNIRQFMRVAICHDTLVFLYFSCSLQERLSVPGRPGAATQAALSG